MANKVMTQAEWAKTQTKTKNYNPMYDVVGYRNYTAMQPFIQASEQSRQANERRYSEMMGIYDTIAQQYAPGGQFMKGAEAGLERTKERDVASEVAQTVSSGLYGTTVPSTAAKKWEEDIGAPQRLKLEDVRMQAYAGALGQKAGAVERREDMYPDYSLMSQLLSQGSSYGGGTTVRRSSGPAQYAFGGSGPFRRNPISGTYRY